MFGYLKPYNEELKQKNINEYKRMYCSLCYGLRQYLGIISSFLLSNECTFLFIFLDGLSQNLTSTETCFRCPINPIQKTKVQLNDSLLSYVCFINYHLALLSIRDHYLDSQFIKRWGYKLCYNWLKRRRKYKKLLSVYATTADKITAACDNLNYLETRKGSTYDDCSQHMGQLLVDIICNCPVLNEKELNSSVIAFGFHLGMWVYLIDAYDDLEKDLTNGCFNPLRSFLAPEDANAMSICAQLGELMLSLMYSNLCSLSSQIHYYRHNELINNIIVFGTCHAAGKAKRKKERNGEKHGSNTG